MHVKETRYLDYQRASCEQRNTELTAILASIQEKTSIGNSYESIAEGLHDNRTSIAEVTIDVLLFL
jgi:hypothetical protein